MSSHCNQHGYVLPSTFPFISINWWMPRPTLPTDPSELNTHTWACRPVEEKERHLTQKGPVWKAPSFIQVLRSIPFLRHTPQRIVEVRLLSPCCCPMLCGLGKTVCCSIFLF